MIKPKEDDRILDCSHKPSPHGKLTTGTAHTPDGKEICWTCADDEQRDDLQEAEEFTGYLSEDSKQITTWSGGHLASMFWLSAKNYGYTPTGGYHEYYYLKALDVWGQLWYGRTPGPGMYARMHKSKGGR